MTKCETVQMYRSDWRFLKEKGCLGRLLYSVTFFRFGDDDQRIWGHL